MYHYRRRSEYKTGKRLTGTCQEIGNKYYYRRSDALRRQRRAAKWRAMTNGSHKRNAMASYAASYISSYYNMRNKQLAVLAADVDESFERAIFLAASEALKSATSGCWWR